jgi:type I site-specific restriction endonuclease
VGAERTGSDSRGVAVREFKMAVGYDTTDYLLFVDRKAVGVIEAKKEGTTLTGVEPQSAKYTSGLPDGVSAILRPLPFAFESTGIETRFTKWFRCRSGQRSCDGGRESPRGSNCDLRGEVRGGA